MGNTMNKHANAQTQNPKLGAIHEHALQKDATTHHNTLSLTPQTTLANTHTSGWGNPQVLHKEMVTRTTIEGGTAGRPHFLCVPLENNGTTAKFSYQGSQRNRLRFGVIRVNKQECNDSTGESATRGSKQRTTASTASISNPKQLPVSTNSITPESHVVTRIHNTFNTTRHRKNSNQDPNDASDANREDENKVPCLRVQQHEVARETNSNFTSISNNDSSNNTISTLAENDTTDNRPMWELDDCACFYLKLGTAWAFGSSVGEISDLKTLPTCGQVAIGLENNKMVLTFGASKFILNSALPPGQYVAAVATNDSATKVSIIEENYSLKTWRMSSHATQPLPLRRCVETTLCVALRLIHNSIAQSSQFMVLPFELWLLILEHLLPKDFPCLQE